MIAKAEFDELLEKELIPSFCSDTEKLVDPSGFVEETNLVSERDANDFLRAWKAGLVVHKDCGRYLVCEARVTDQFFWERRKTLLGRKFSLWMEPVITVAALARLHLDLGWPKGQLVSQPDNWAFDLAALSSDGSTVILGEVKKTLKETEALIERMLSLAETPDSVEPPSGADRNAFKKVAALRKVRPSLFWAVGPDGFERVFKIAYDHYPSIRLIPAEKLSLRYCQS